MVTDKGIETIKGMSFNEFIESKKTDNTLQFQFDPLFNDERLFLKGFGKVLFNTCLFCYMIAPIILVPTIAYKFDDWYLLFGILFSYFSTYLAIRKKSWQWAAPLLFMLWYWYSNGFHLNDYINFYWLCLFWGGFTYSLAIGYEDEFAKSTILKDPDLFNKLSQNGTIFFMRKVKKTEEIDLTENWEFYYFKARASLIRKDDIETVIEYLDKAIELKPNYAKLYWNRGLANMELKDYKSAVSDFDKSIKISPNDGVGYYGRAYANFELGNAEAARPDYAKAVSLGISKIDQVLDIAGRL